MKLVDVPEYGVWSKKWGEDWEKSFVVGNGTVGGMLFGEPTKSHFILNAPDYFLKGQPMDYIPDLAEFVPELRRKIREEGYDVAIRYFEELAFERGYPGFTGSDPYHPLLQVDWEFDGKKIREDSFSRITDYANGFIAETFSDIEGNKYQKRIFINQENELVWIIEGEDKFSGKLSVVDFQQERLSQNLVVNDYQFEQTNQYIDGTGYFTSGKLDLDGEIEISRDAFLVKDSKKLVIRIALDKKVTESKDIEKIFQENCQRWSEMYQETALIISSTEERLRSIDDIIEEMERTNKIPLVLFEKLYDGSRYVMQSYSGKSMPNLQGIWSGTFKPRWNSDYTFNTNLELAISSMSRLGMFEQLKAVFNRLEAYFEDFEENAMRYYGCRGYLVPGHGSTTAKNVQWKPAFPHIMWTSGAAWLAHFYAEYVNYTNDLEFLKEKAIPYYQNTLLFYEDFLTREEDGTLLFSPSYSPENGMGDNATFDVAAVKETLLNLMEGYRLLDERVPGKYREMLEALPAYAINDEGVLKEWIDPRNDENYNHRHFSQFYPVFESREIRPETQPELWNAALKGFSKKMDMWVLNKESGNTSSHGRMHAAMCAISFGRVEDLERSIEEFVINRAFFDSLVTAHYNQQDVFNVDANGSLPRIYNDSLFYVVDNKNVRLFQSVPYWLEKGEIRGIALPNNTQVVSFVWNVDERTFTLELESKVNTELSLDLSTWDVEDIQLELVAGEKKVLSFIDGKLT